MMPSSCNSDVETAHELLTKRVSGFGLMLLALLVAGCASPSASRPPAPPPELKPATLSLPPLGKDTPAPSESALQGIPPKPIVEDNIIYFAPGSTRIDLAGEQKLRIHASRLVENRKTIVTLIGLTDNQGSRSFNLAIAEQRIDAAAKILRTHGVLKNQIRLYARGNKTPDSACKTETCREKMRRVELHYENP